MTLVEVMVSAVVMAGVLLSTLTAVVQAYRMNEMARRRDEVRAILQSFVDNFLCGQVRDEDTDEIYAFYKVRVAATGEGLSWTDSSGTSYTGTSSGLSVPLAGTGAPTVVFTYWVRQVDETDTTGTPDFSDVDKSAVGREIVGVFTASFEAGGKSQSISMSVVRADT